MKFGRTLKTSLIQEYVFYYISYNDLKSEIKNRSAGHQWNEDDEKAFVEILEAELDKVFTFQKVKGGGIVRRIKSCEKQVGGVVRELDSHNPPSEEVFLDLEQELSDVIADVHDLAKFTQLNYTGFQKIIKKHDKQTGWNLRPIFAARLNAKPFYKDNYDAFVVKLSKLYDLIRTRGTPTNGDSSAGGSQQNFVRQTTKYWVHPDNITELKLIILKHLPVLVFNANKEFEKQDSAITSIYYDNADLDLYLGRLEKNEGAEAIRVRWYGGMDVETAFIERKTHREDWTGEKSVKARFSLKDKKVAAFMKGQYTVELAFAKMRSEGKRSVSEIEDLEALAKEVQYSVLTRRLQPVVRSFYNRTAFQLPGDARVRISLDTELAMVREDEFDGKKRAGESWRRTDIGIDWPFSQLNTGEVELFPYAILEVKLQTQHGQEPPEWVRDLVSSHLVEAIPKFSKFIHGVSTLLPDRINVLPYWQPQMHIDIRKPVSHHFGLERTNASSSISTSENNDSGGDILDAEERVGEMLPEEEEIPYEDGDENQPLLRSIHHGRTGVTRRVGNMLTEASRRLLPAAADSQVETVYERKFRAPPGKRISVPVRIEPKVHFAAERTFLSWVGVMTLC